MGNQAEKLPWDPTKRFADDESAAILYERARPYYKPEHLDPLLSSLNLPYGAVIAEIAAGTGPMTIPLLDRGFEVVAVEPNQHLRNRLVYNARSYDKFYCTNGTAEKTGLGYQQADAIAIATAIHWFDQEQARMEFDRISKPPKKAFILNRVPHPRDAGIAIFDEFLRKECPGYTSAPTRNDTNARKIEDYVDFYFDEVLHAYTSIYYEPYDEIGFLNYCESCSPFVDWCKRGDGNERLSAYFHEHAVDGILPFAMNVTGYSGYLR